MESRGTTPLSPSRQANATLGAPTPRKKLVLEQEDGFDDFFAAAALAEAEAGQDDERQAGRAESPVASISLARAAIPAAKNSAPEDTEIINSRPGVKEGKRRLVLEPEDGFGDGMDLEDLPPRPRPMPPMRERDFSSTSGFGAAHLPSLNLNLRPGEIEAASISATTLDGRKITFGRRKKLESWQDSSAQKREDSDALAKLAGSMLEMPYARMVEEIEGAALLAKKHANADATNAAMDVDTPRDDGLVDSTLWTDRYRPKRFTDLLGDERVHRSALLWLKEWDQCVFKGAGAKGSAATELKRERRKKRAREGKFDAPAAGSSNGDEEQAADPFGRPNEKILLLCGPPGLGKTTLAHVLAKQAGYQVLEVNASDDRTGRIVEERIRNALESRALTMDGGMSGNKPTCVVVDEVDGAGGGGESSFVKTLVKLVMEGSSTRKYKGKGKKDRPLLRPIICICNDLYAPVLRPLRPLAKIVRFTPPTNTMLVSRLKNICTDEGLGADAKNLTMLAEIAEGDLRSCLNTLQFIKRRSTVVDEAAIRSTVVGLKDTGTSATQVIDRLFKKPPRKKGGGGGGGADDRYVNRIVRDVQTSGEYEKISQGCFENYLGARQLTDTWPRILEATDWLFLYDRLDGRLRSDRDYELLAYVPYAFVPWYKLFSSYTSAQMEFPKSDYEAYLKRVAHQEIAQTFAQSIPHSLKTLFTGPNIIAELLPLLNRIISPDLKPVNSQLIKPEERAVMLKLISTMLSMKLSFVQDKNEDGQLTYKLDPPIDVFVHFDGKRASDIAPSRYAVRHLITREIEAEEIRRGQGESITNNAGDIIAAYRVKPPAAKADVKEAIDFFGRAIIAKPLSTQEAAALPKVKAQKAVYRFHEGFSNAVRTTKRVADFLV